MIDYEPVIMLSTTAAGWFTLFLWLGQGGPALCVLAVWSLLSAWVWLA